jgi:hypothetical protein
MMDVALDAILNNWYRGQLCLYRLAATCCTNHRNAQERPHQKKKKYNVKPLHEIKKSFTAIMIVFQPLDGSGAFYTAS